MTGPSDQFTTVGNEAVAWGTAAATLTRWVGQEPGNKPAPRVELRPPAGFIPGYLGDAASFTVVNTRGGVYPLKVDLLSKGQLLLWAGLTATANVAIATPDGATNARLVTITPSDHALRSTTIHDAVALLDGSLTHVNMLGGKVVDLGLSVAPNGNVKLNVNYDYRTTAPNASSVTPAIPAGPYTYQDTDFTTTVDGVAACQRGVDFTIPSGGKMDQDRICPGGREEPVVLGKVRPTGTITPDLASITAFADFLAGTSHEIVHEATGPEIESGFDNFVRVTFADTKWTGEGYDRALEDLTGQPLPWQAYDNGTDPLWKIEIQTTDTTIS